MVRGDWAVGDADFRGRMAQVLGRPLRPPLGRPPRDQTAEEVHL